MDRVGTMGRLKPYKRNVMKHMKLFSRSISSILILVLIVLTFAASSEPVSAASKKKSVAYTDAYKIGNIVYCNAEYFFCSIDLRTGNVKYHSRDKFLHYSDFQKRGRYLYSITQTSGALNYLVRIDLKTGKKKTLARDVFDYKLTKKKIYYSHIYYDKKWNEVPCNMVMKRNGKAKHRTKVKVKMKRKKSNAKGYRVYSHGVEVDDETYYIDNYLITPGRNYYLGRTYW